jgi:predicted metal-dependent phosphoesterase TrpH
VIDLHLHTTASDGRCTPGELVDRASAAGLTIMAVTDHDTTGAVATVRALARERGIEAIPGIEITAVEKGLDVHVLGYFIDPEDAALDAFLAEQRAHRVARVEAMAARLGTLGLPVDLGATIDAARGQRTRSIGRPQIARAMIAAGYVMDVREAFDRWLGPGCPAFVPREGARVAGVIAAVHAAGGLASLAHPGRTRLDDRIEAFCDAGLDAIEVFHSDHDALQVDRNRRMARTLGRLVTGGSDFHGDPQRALNVGGTTLPRGDWDALSAARPRHG